MARGSGPIRPGAEVDVPIGGADIPVIIEALGDHGGAPYEIETRSPTGAILGFVSVNASQAASLADGGPAVVTETGVPCGVIRLVVGDLPANEAPAPAASIAPGPLPLTFAPARPDRDSIRLSGSHPDLSLEDP